MKRYKLRKDTPTIKAGTIFEEVVSDFDGAKELARITPVGAKTNPQWTIRDIDNFDEWFEEVEEPTDSIHWNPMIGEKCFILENANIIPTLFTGKLRDYNAWRTGKVFRTEEGCEKARDRELAEVRLRRTSTFKPDFKNGKGGYSVGYDYIAESLRIYPASWVDAGEPVRYETEEDAQKSIDKHEKEWLAFFGIKKGEQEECRR
jgi:hypothetical protein